MFRNNHPEKVDARNFFMSDAGLTIDVENMKKLFADIDSGEEQSADRRHRKGRKHH